MGLHFERKRYWMDSHPSNYPDSCDRWPLHVHGRNDGPRYDGGRYDGKRYDGRRYDGLWLRLQLVWGDNPVDLLLSLYWPDNLWSLLLRKWKHDETRQEVS